MLRSHVGASTPPVLTVPLVCLALSWVVGKVLYMSGLYELIGGNGLRLTIEDSHGPKVCVHGGSASMVGLRPWRSASAPKISS